MNRTVRALGAFVIGAGLALTTMSPATALPPAGAGPDTPGTSASVSPRALTAGATIRFTVSGFPAGETVYIKIDDGASCSKDAAQGACVYHSQKLSSKGSASGSFVLPRDLAPGKHWLRLLASKEIYADDGEFQGVEGYTRRGGTDFTVVAAGNGAPSGDGGGTGSGSGSGGGSTSSGTGAPAGVPGQTTGTGQASVTAQGGVVKIQPVDVEPTLPEPTQPSASPLQLDQDDTRAAIKPLSLDDDSSSFPIVGTVGLVLLLLVSAAIVAFGIRRPSGRSPGA